MLSKDGNEEQCQIIPDYFHDFASGPVVETQLSWLFHWLFLIFALIIPKLFPIIPIMLTIEAGQMVIH